LPEDTICGPVEIPLAEHSKQKAANMPEHDSHNDSTRRRFLQTAGMGSAVIVGGVLGDDLAASGATGDNLVSNVDLGVWPDVFVDGGVILEGSKGTYLTFRANDARGKYTGTAVIEMSDLLKSRYRYPGGTTHEDDSFLADSLRPCEVFEVTGSTWLGRVRASLPKADQGRAARHFIFTFAGTSFECLARELIVDVWTQPYPVIVDALT
jgi:hypothetical protein